MCRAWQEQIENDTKFQNASGGVLENSFKSELESFIEADVKSSTAIPPIVSHSATYCFNQLMAGMLSFPALYLVR